MENIIIDSYLISITDPDFLVEGITPLSVKNILKDIKQKDIELFVKKYDKKIKKVDNKRIEKEIDDVAKKNGIKKENVTTSKVMLKRFFGTLFVGVPATLILPISLACLIACIIRTIKNKESVINNTLAIIKEIKSGIKTTRRTNITNMEKAAITAGQTADYLWGILSSEPIVVLRNLLAFIGLYIVAIYHFWKGIIFAGQTIKT